MLSRSPVASGLAGLPRYVYDDWANLTLFYLFPLFNFFFFLFFFLTAIYSVAKPGFLLVLEQQRMDDPQPLPVPCMASGCVVRELSPSMPQPSGYSMAFILVPGFPWF